MSDDFPKVFIVDPDYDTRHLLESRISLKQYDVHCYSDASSAIASALELKPDVILFGYDIGVMDGYEFSRTIRQDPVYEVISDSYLIGMGYFPDGSRKYLDSIEKKKDLCSGGKLNNVLKDCLPLGYWIEYQ